LIFCDLDSFKEVNDRYGHLVGDRLLIEVADRLRACVGADDFIARFGGDEFVLLLHAPTTDDVVRTQACIAEAFGRPYDASGAPVRISASVGAVVSDSDLRFTTAEQLISQADAAMYARKRRPPTPSTVQPQWEPAN
jgi:diguanylate cyclase (GGDEF)-like protein